MVATFQERYRFRAIHSAPLMALNATMYRFAVQLSDVDRGVYESLELHIARQPSETAEYMLTRVLAYCLEYTEGIELTEGVASGDEPAVLVRDLTGRVLAWIEEGAPDADRLHRGSKAAQRAVVYSHREPRMLLEQLNGKKIHRAGEIPIHTFGRGFIESIASTLDRRTALAVTVTERQLYLDLDGRTFTTTIEEHRLS